MDPNVFRPGNPSQGIPLPIGIVSCLFRQKCWTVCPLYIAESAKTTSFPSIYRDCLSHGVNASFPQSFHLQNAMELQGYNNPLLTDECVFFIPFLSLTPNKGVTK